MTIPENHSIFTPVRDYAPGHEIDPETVDVTSEKAVTLSPGQKIIVDNRVEMVTAVVAV